jgi:hypothetical protein
MNRALQRTIVVLFALAACLAVFSSRSHASLAQVQRDQVSVNIIINVTPAAGYVPPPVKVQPAVIAVRLREARGSAQNVDALPAGELIAQTAQQKALKVEATVTPNPLATLLYSNSPGVVMNATAGTAVTQPCIYTVTVHTTVTSWTLRQGLSGDFASGFPGTDLANNSYLQGATPQPTSTPFVVYPTSWTVLASSGGIKTYCVDLTVTVPAAVAGGAYSTNAVYTIYY